MNMRRIIYIAVLIFVAVVFFRGFTGEKAQDLYGLERITPQELLNDFETSAPNSITDEESGQMYNIEAMLFPKNFTGESGDAFYVQLKNDGDYLTIMYRITEADNDDDEKRLEYVRKERWDNVKLPQQKFEVYHRQNNQWVKVD